MDMQTLSQARAEGEHSAARQLLRQLFDQGSFVEIDRLAKSGDGPAEAVAGFGTIGGVKVYAFAQDKDICCGAVGKAQAAKIAKVYSLAAANGAPIVGFFDSDGARLGDGLDAMDAIAELLHAANQLSGVVPQLAVIAGSCVGSSAMIAASADLVIAAGEVDYYLSPGDAAIAPDITVPDLSAALDTVRNLIDALPANNLEMPPAHEEAQPAEGGKTGLDLVADALSQITLSDATALIRVNGWVCGAVTLTGDKLSAEVCAKAARFVRFCDAFSLPLITFVDAAGFDSLKSAMLVTQAYAQATTAKITVITGKAYGPVYIATAGKSAGADVVLAWPSAVISPLAPEAAVHIVWKDRLAAMQQPEKDRPALIAEYAETACSPLHAAAAGYVSDIVAPAETREAVTALLHMLSDKRVTSLPKKHANLQL